MTYFSPTDYGMDTGPSAAAIVDLLLQWIKPASVIDVGCGTGVFLEEFKKRGVGTVLGLDGEATGLVFGPGESEFMVADLTQPLELDRGFDLALCLEVVEHLPESSANLLVNTLTDLAPLVLFSSAHPGQGGQGHINERWPVYWQRRFSQHGFVALDIVRGPLCDNPVVLDCYRRNAMLYVEFSRCASILADADESGVADAFVLTHMTGVTTELEHQSWRILILTLLRKLRRRFRRSVHRLTPTIGR